MVYPVHVFVCADGVWRGASETDQPNSRLRVRTIDGALAVSIGSWDSSQLPYKPFKDMLAVGAAEAAELSVRQYQVRRGRINEATWRQHVAGFRKDALPHIVLAVHSILVHGMPINAAAARLLLTRRAKTGADVGRPPEDSTPIAELMAEPAIAGLLTNDDDVAAVLARGRDDPRVLRADEPLSEAFTAGRSQRAVGIECLRRHGIITGRGEPPCPVWAKRFASARRQLQRAVKSFMHRLADRPVPAPEVISPHGHLGPTEGRAVTTAGGGG